MHKEPDKTLMEQWNMQLFPAAAPLKFIAIDILGQLLNTNLGNIFLLVITTRFPKLVKTVPIPNISAGAISETVDHQALEYGLPKWVLYDNGQHFTSIIYQNVCRALDIENQITTIYITFYVTGSWRDSIELSSRHCSTSSPITLENGIYIQTNWCMRTRRKYIMLQDALRSIWHCKALHST